MTFNKIARAGMLSAVAGVLITCAQAMAADQGSVVKMQGTWHDESGDGAGTWRVELAAKGNVVFQKATEFGTWERLEGTSRIDSSSGFAEAPVSAWANSENVGFRVTGGEWKDTLFSGTVSSTEASGTFRKPGGQMGAWRGWWVNVPNGGARTVDTAIEQSEVLNAKPSEQ